VDLAEAALLESWQLSLHAKRPRTVEVYLRELDRFARWLTDNGGGTLATATKRDVLAWIGDQQQRGLKPNTVRARWIALRAFYGWAAGEGEVEVDPVAGVNVPRSHEPAPDTLTDREITLLLKACEGTGFNERRDLALFRMMLATGMRVSETENLTMGDLDLPSRIAALRDTKGGRSRVVRFDAATAAALDRYKRTRARHRFATSEAMWLGSRGPIRRKTVALILDKRTGQAGIDHVFPHQLRHTWADRWLGKGGTEADMMRLGGWESPTIARRYGEARAVDRALGAYDQIDPMGGL
jgi:integrase/recombinase XerD